MLEGSIEPALFQIGAIETLLANAPAPAVVYAAGFSTVAGLLLSSGGGVTAMRRRWEALRARHLLFSAALGRVPVLGSTLGATALMTRQLTGLSDVLHLPGSANGAVPGVTPVAIELMGAAGFEEVVPATATVSRNSLLAQALTWVDAGGESVALAIERAARRGVTEIVVIGPDEGAAAVAQAAAHQMSDTTCRISILPWPAREPLGLLDVLLPGSGAVERRILEGQRAAHHWLGHPPGARRDQSAGFGSAAGAAGRNRSEPSESKNAG